MPVGRLTGKSLNGQSIGGQNYNLDPKWDVLHILDWCEGKE